MSGWVQKKHPDGHFVLVPKDEVAQWMEAHYPKKNRTAVKYRRVERGSWVWDRDQKKLIQRSAQVIQLRPRGPQIIKDIEPFQNVAVDGGYIGGRKQKRDMMRAHNLIEAGDIRADKPVPKPYDPRKHQASVVNSIKRAFHQHGLGD